MVLALADSGTTVALLSMVCFPTLKIFHCKVIMRIDELILTVLSGPVRWDTTRFLGGCIALAN